jgi:hypothetical protein
MWFPAREDLDTMLSKIDSGIIHNIIVLKGPYSAHYGPGLSFIDVETNSVLPSFTNEGQNGLWGRGRTTLNYQTQGQAWYGRQSFWGGSSDWGFRFSYGNRTGNDYDSGDNLQIPASYHAQDFDTAFGMDLSQDSHIELGYRRLDQTDTEYPGEVFDINFLVTDGYNMRYTLENQAYFDRLVVETWYNRTRFEGDAQGHGKRRQIPELDLINFIGFTDVDEMSTGFRLATTWGGEEGCSALTMGVDLRYQNQELNEFDALDIPTRPPGLSNFAIPRSHSSDPGVFLEGSLPLNDCWVIKAGSRIDWVANDIDDTPDGRTRAEMADILGTDEFDQQFTLWAAYITSEYKLDQHWSSVAAFGTAERSPTLTQLYALDPFLALLQQGITQVRGNPDLHAERAYQIDFGLRADYQRFRGGVGAFYSWINDFITYEAQEDLRSSGVPNALGVQFVNTDWATLSGAEMYGEYDWNDWLTPFASMSYVEGRDHTRGNRGIIAGASEEPLPSISPLQTRVGFRYHQPCENPRWAIEFSARIVDNQDRVASSLLEQPTGGFTTYDLRAFWKAVDSEQTGLLLVAGIENLTDKNYREHLDLRTGRGVFQPGINFYFGVELTY